MTVRHEEEITKAKIGFGSLDIDELNFKHIFEKVPSPYLILDLNYNIVACTDAYIGITKSERSQILLRNVFDVFPDDPNDLDARGSLNLKKSLDRVKKTKKTDIMSIMKYNIPDPDSVNNAFLERYWQTSNFPLFDDAGELVFIINYVDDVTSFVKIRNKANSTELANLQLNETRIFLESILDNIPSIVFVKDAKELKYLKVNKACEAFAGAPQEALIGKTDYDVFSNEQAAVFIGQDREVLASGKNMDMGEEEMDLPTGKRIIHTIKVPLRDQNRNNLYLIGISEDITDKVELRKAQIAQKASEEMLKRKNQFLDTAAHELRTPITSLSLLIQFAQKKLERGLPLKFDLLERLKRPAERLNRLVIDLLDMSRLERGQLVLIRQKTDIVDLITKCVEDFRIQAPRRKLNFETQNREMIIDIDPVRINQVLSNLIDNALKYADQSKIDIKLEEKVNGVRVTVRDYGPGIPKEQHESIFSAFSRGSSDATIKASGLGLGLSVCQGIINLHNGIIGLESVERNGSAFYFELPKTIVKK